MLIFVLIWGFVLHLVLTITLYLHKIALISMILIISVIQLCLPSVTNTMLHGDNIDLKGTSGFQ